MISETTRIAGSSVALTSLANFCGFVVGTTMVLPDVARFATFGALIVLLNFIAIIFGFTAVLSLVARRMKSEYNDWSFLFCFATFMKASKITSEKPSSEAPSIFDPLFDWLTKNYTRIVMIIIFITLIIVGIYGCTLIAPGLPLADIVPDDSYAYDFLRIREKFYHSYIVSLYTDADGAELEQIDWPNKFADFIDKTEDYASISDLVYSEPIHDFWSWELRDYLIDQYDESLSGEYTLGTAVDLDELLEADVVRYQPYMCETDRLTYCKYNNVNYDYGSALFYCLLINYNLGYLQDEDCDGYVYQEYLENYDLGDIATQLYVTSYENDTNGVDVNGLYARPSTNDIKVFIKQPDEDGYIYQTDCGDDECEWYLLDESFNILYVGESTSTDSEQPSMAGWRDPVTGEQVQVTHIYYDWTINYLGIDRDTEDEFEDSDIDPPTDFTFSNYYTPSSPSDDNTAACSEWELFKLLMGDSTAFDTLSMSSTLNVSGDSDAVCDAILESSEMCVALSAETDLGSIVCGKWELQTNQNMWYLGEFDDLYNVISSPEDVNSEIDLNISLSTAMDGCEDPSAISSNTEYTYNYLRPCGGDTGFGGFGIRADMNDTFCNEDDQDITLECKSITDCTDLRVCFNDYRYLFEDLGYRVDCTLSDVTKFDTKYKNDPTNTERLAEEFSQCLISHYSLLTDCCQDAANEQIFDRDDYDCGVIDVIVSLSNDGTTEDLRQACAQKDKCEYTEPADGEEFGSCTEVCTGDVWNDCNDLINDNYCYLLLNDTQIRGGDQSAFFSCVQTALDDSVTFSVTPYDCCQDTLDSLATEYEDCSQPIPSYWDWTVQQYDYSICDDADISSMTDMPCNDTYLATETQRECLETNVDLIADGCCKEAITQMFTNTYSFTVECESDAQRICGISASTALVLAEAGYTSCSDAVFSYFDYLAPKCQISLFYCDPLTDDDGDGEWPATYLGGTELLSCDDGYSGNKTRTCTTTYDDDGLPAAPAYWDDIDTSSCVLKTCPAFGPDDNMTTDADAYGQYWPETDVGQVVTIQGGIINTILGSFGDDTLTALGVDPYLEALNTIQVSYELQLLFISKFGYVCAPEVDYNEWYATRYCGLNEYTLEPEWKEPTVECRGFYSYWDNMHEETVCDFLTEQVTAELSGYFDAYDDAIESAYGFDPGLGDGASITTITNANMIDVIGWEIYAELYTNGYVPDEATQIALSQQYCESVLTNCMAFSYDSYLQYTYFFDYCPTLQSSDLLTGQISAVTSSPGYQDAFDTLAYVYGFGLGAGSLFSYWGAYGLSDFAENITTYTAPLNLAQFTAQWCSLSSLNEAADLTTNEFDPSLFVAPNSAWNASGIPNERCFNNTLWLFFIDPTGGVLYRDKIYFLNPTAIYDSTAFDDVQIVSTYNSLNVRNVDDDEVAVEFIIALRDRLDEWKEDEIYVIPGGLVIDLFSQYIGVDEYLVTNLLIVAIFVALCGLIFLLNPIAVIVALICNLAMIVEVYGFADWFGLRVNGVLVLNIVIAVALTMEFTAHIGRAFVLTSVTEKDRMSSIALPFSNDGQIRMKKTLREMFTPVSLGALTTLIGVAPISAAQFPYFRQYYFTLYIMIVLFGWLNGVIFQVIILSFIPPKPFHMQQPQSSDVVQPVPNSSNSQLQKSDETRKPLNTNDLPTRPADDAP